jgi:hypothetical protein
MPAYRHRLRVLSSVNLLLMKTPRIPNERMSLQVELATEASSSTTMTSVDSPAFALEATLATSLVALSGSVLLSLSTGDG